jgi:deoxyribodipyrimidine photo-lyase
MHKIWKTRAQLQSAPDAESSSRVLASLKSFESRLHWHCHFIQKLESQPAIEMQNMHSGFDGLREPHFNHEYFERWKKGETGFPLIDACMRMLAQTGWINFRMRALLISFSSYQLWNHWREPALHLAREFLDYEPGIHYPQIQMQSGVTGINTLRKTKILKVYSSNAGCLNCTTYRMNLFFNRGRCHLSYSAKSL